MQATWNWNPTGSGNGIGNRNGNRNQTHAAACPTTATSSLEKTDTEIKAEGRAAPQQGLVSNEHNKRIHFPAGQRAPSSRRLSDSC